MGSVLRGFAQDHIELPLLDHVESILVELASDATSGQKVAVDVPTRLAMAVPRRVTDKPYQLSVWQILKNTPERLVCQAVGFHRPLFACGRKGTQNNRRIEQLSLRSFDVEASFEIRRIEGTQDLRTTGFLDGSLRARKSIQASGRQAEPTRREARRFFLRP